MLSLVLCLVALAWSASPAAHSHNDYLQERPLIEALEHGYRSVEVDLWHRSGRLVAAHTRLNRGRDFRALYVEPLAARIAETGSVYGDGAPFTLWLDLKEDDPALLEALRALFAERPFGDAVLIVLTGNDAAKRALVEGAPLGVSRDSNDWSPDDPPVDGPWAYYALSWKRYAGRGATPEQARAALAPVIEAAHAGGRQVRLYGAPDTPESWALQAELGLDFIGTDDVAGLAGFLSAP
ncbi:MAG: hypothetical protein H6740_17705 [Alphaproteobacteria bacterium]|nr:hypothetical protein [Alphaproteobacteria bacterium]